MIYMDNAATTRLCDEAYRAMLPYLCGSYGNPGGLYDLGLEAKKAVGTAREEISRTINAGPSGIYFTSGGTEADNWAIRGIAELFPHSHIITTSFEHHAVLNTCKWLERNGTRVSYVNPDPSGYISVKEIEKHICGDTVLISMMHINNELGTVQPVKELGRLAHDRGILFHTDAVAAYGHIPIDVKAMNIDLLSASAHKFGGPKGVGFLYADETVRLPSLLHGGSQEKGRRGGTENVPGIAGMAAAAARAHRDMDMDLNKRYRLDGYFVEGFNALNSVKKPENGGSLIHLNGYGSEYKAERRLENMDPEGKPDITVKRLPGYFSLTIPGRNAEELIVRLGMEGICVSAGAACASVEEGGSHVLKAIGLNDRSIESSVRVTMNEDNTEDEIDSFFNALRRLI
jgi:cysteine desulfurase